MEMKHKPILLNKTRTHLPILCLSILHASHAIQSNADVKHIGSLRQYQSKIVCRGPKKKSSSANGGLTSITKTTNKEKACEPPMEGSSMQGFQVSPSTVESKLYVPDEDKNVGETEAPEKAKCKLEEVETLSRENLNVGEAEAPTKAKLSLDEVEALNTAVLNLGEGSAPKQTKLNLDEVEQLTLAGLNLRETEAPEKAKLKLEEVEALSLASLSLGEGSAPKMAKLSLDEVETQTNAGVEMRTFFDTEEENAITSTAQGIVSKLLQAYQSIEQYEESIQQPEKKNGGSFIFGSYKGNCEDARDFYIKYTLPQVQEIGVLFLKLIRTVDCDSSIQTDHAVIEDLSSVIESIVKIDGLAETESFLASVYAPESEESKLKIRAQTSKFAFNGAYRTLHDFLVNIDGLRKISKLKVSVNQGNQLSISDTVKQASCFFFEFRSIFRTWILEKCPLLVTTKLRSPNAALTIANIHRLVVSPVKETRQQLRNIMASIPPMDGVNPDDLNSLRDNFNQSVDLIESLVRTLFEIHQPILPDDYFDLYLKLTFLLGLFKMIKSTKIPMPLTCPTTNQSTNPEENVRESEHLPGFDDWLVRRQSRLKRRQSRLKRRQSNEIPMQLTSPTRNQFTFERTRYETMNYIITVANACCHYASAVNQLTSSASSQSTDTLDRDLTVEFWKFIAQLMRNSQPLFDRVPSYLAEDTLCEISQANEVLDEKQTGEFPKFIDRLLTNLEPLFKGVPLSLIKDRLCEISQANEVLDEK